MGDIKNPFGIRDGKIVTIGDIPNAENGLQCNCICPNCRGAFVARKGSVRIHHFAHEKDAMCDSEKAFLIALYRLLEEAIREFGSFRYPGVYAKKKENIQIPNSYIVSKDQLKDLSCIHTAPKASPEDEELIRPGEIHPTEIDTITAGNGKPEAMLLTASIKEKTVTLAVVLVPPDTICKSFAPKAYKEFSTIAIDVSDLDMYSIQGNALKKILAEGLYDKTWIQSQKIDSWVESLSKIQDKEYARYCEEIRIKNAQLEKEQKERRMRQESLRQENAQRLEEQKRKLEEAEREAEQQRLAAIASFPLELRDNYDSDPQKYENENGQVWKYDIRWIKCIICKKWKDSSDMSSYGGRGKELNQGICHDCSRGG